jgi:uncharacterized protein
MSEFLTAEWNNLIMANYAVDPALLKPYLPVKTEFDAYNGELFVSLVGFMFNNTRLMGWKIPFHVNFEEVNLRFYVRYYDNGEWKRGTVFIKEIVPRPAISFIANAVYHEKYSTKRMRHFCSQEGSELSIGYHWKHRQKWNKLEAKTSVTAAPMTAGSAAQFIAEHYWGYSKYNEQTTFEYHVQHPPWNVYDVKSYLVDCDFAGLYGPAFSELDNAKPSSVLVAKGSPIAVLKKRTL